MKTLKQSIVLVLSVLVFASCGSADNPGAMVETFIKHVKNKEVEKAKSMVIADSEEMIDPFSKQSIVTDQEIQSSEYALTSESLAVVVVKGNLGDEVFYVVKDNGEWKIDLMYEWGGQITQNYDMVQINVQSPDIELKATHKYNYTLDYTYVIEGMTVSKSSTGRFNAVSSTVFHADQIGEISLSREETIGSLKVVCRIKDQDQNEKLFKELLVNEGEQQAKMIL